MISAETLAEIDCPPQAACAQPEARPCEFPAGYLPQLPLAEDICFGGLLVTLLGEMNKTPSDYPLAKPRNTFRRAWANAELGLSKSSTQEQADAYFAASDASVSEILDSPIQDADISIEATRLRLYLPKIKARKSGKLFTPDDHQRLIFGLGMCADSALGAPLHDKQEATAETHFLEDGHVPCFLSEGERLGRCAKLGAELVLLKAGYNIFPTSHRESLGSRGEHKSYPHNVYDLSPGGKRPFRIQAASGKGQPTPPRHSKRRRMMIAFGSLVQNALGSERYGELGPQESIFAAVRAMAHDAQRQPMTVEDARIASGMTSYIQGLTRSFFEPRP